MKLTSFLGLAILSVISTTVYAQHAEHHSAYQGQENREIKSLSEREIEGLRTGKGLGLAKAAELNGLPGPKHVLELKKELNLTGEQESKMVDLFSEMKEESTALGMKLLQKEKELEAFFQSENPSEEKMTKIVAAIANIRGMLRATHLKFHLRTPKILTQHQVKQYFQLRGYKHSGHTGH